MLGLLSPVRTPNKERRARFGPKEAGALGGEDRKLARGKRALAGEVSSGTVRGNAARSGVLASAR
jgi:hypothetical protein